MINDLKQESPVKAKRQMVHLNMNWIYLIRENIKSINNVWKYDGKTASRILKARQCNQ